MSVKSTKLIYIGVDDTDNHESRGTGRLARDLAADLMTDFPVLGVTRHQLLVDPRVPYTSHNSSAALCLQGDSKTDLEALFERVKALMLADFITGSDPGLCVAREPIAQAVRDFGQRAKTELVAQSEARELAAAQQSLLEGLGGTQDGVIGALAAVGLAASGEDGRYLLVGSTRELSGLQPVSAVIQAGIVAVFTLEGTPVSQGLVLAEKMRPARRGSQPILYVEWDQDKWRPVKLD
jgi:tRNA(Ile2) C34 agmatinyltransferase TiaS